MEKISYASELWKQKQKKAIQEQCYKQLLHELSEYIVDFVSLDSYDPIDFYDTLSSIYSELAEFCYLETEDLEESRLYYYLAAKAGEMTFLLLEKGVPTFSASKESISKNEGAVWYALCAILAGEYDLAMRLVPQGTVLGNLLEGKNFEQSLWGKKIVFLDGYKALFDHDENAFEKKMVQRIQDTRDIVSDPVIIDVLGTALLKLAKKMGIICEVKVAELPEGLLEENRIYYNGNILPEYHRWSAIL